MTVSRIGVRVAALALLAVGVTGGIYLNSDSDSRTGNGGSEASANVAENDILKQDLAEWASLTAEQKAKQAEAAAKAAAEAKAAADRAKAAEAEASRRTANRPPDYGPIPSSCKAYTGAKAIGCAELLKAGFGLDQMPCLDKLWTRESHWNYKSYNSSSGAYGIPQAVPGSKMATVAADWKTNPATQIIWGLGYIKNRYKTPCGAWQHSEDKGWY
ncbi:lytic transglycosylase domain-containing protein [Hamadaea sp. NPDC051192]|uniref:aggregation-promoting factor C-terminal-like domain-containing protein n=1 Tax=Hamadaea sp. NPDC051192 TaxID=3154940 RepID=UPI003413BBF5